MSPDDPRHGSNPGYAQGCRCQPCKDARNFYERQRRKRKQILGIHLSVDATGTRRRLQALMALGHRSKDIAARCGWGTGEAVLEVTHRSWVQSKTAETVARVYDEMSMTLGSSPQTRDRARRAGWLPPLAWEEGTIDDPNARPLTSIKGEGAWDDQIDEAVVYRVINEQRRPRKLTRAESAEVVRILLSRGVSTHVIANDYGIKPERYTTLGDREAS